MSLQQKWHTTWEECVQYNQQVDLDAFIKKCKDTLIYSEYEHASKENQVLCHLRWHVLIRGCLTTKFSSLRTWNTSAMIMGLLVQVIQPGIASSLDKHAVSSYSSIQCRVRDFCTSH